MHTLMALTLIVSTFTVAPETAPKTTSSPTLAGRDASWVGAFVGAAAAATAGYVFLARTEYQSTFALDGRPGGSLGLALVPFTAFAGHLLFGGSGRVEWSLLGAAVGAVLAAGSVVALAGVLVMPLSAAISGWSYALNFIMLGLITSPALAGVALAGGTIGAVVGLLYSHDTERSRVAVSAAPLTSGGALVNAEVRF